jgi:hypothetical protein
MENSKDEILTSIFLIFLLQNMNKVVQNDPFIKWPQLEIVEVSESEDSESDEEGEGPARNTRSKRS